MIRVGRKRSAEPHAALLVSFKRSRNYDPPEPIGGNNGQITVDVNSLIKTENNDDEDENSKEQIYILLNSMINSCQEVKKEVAPNLNNKNDNFQNITPLVKTKTTMEANNEPILNSTKQNSLSNFEKFQYSFDQHDGALIEEEEEEEYNFERENDHNHRLEENPLAIFANVAGEINGDIEQQKPTTSSIRKENGSISCNGVPMVRVRSNTTVENAENVQMEQQQNTTEEFVYDFYIPMSKSLTENYSENVIPLSNFGDPIEARPYDLDQPEAPNESDSDEKGSYMADDEDDENAEDNWRNDYPDEMEPWLENQQESSESSSSNVGSLTDVTELDLVDQMMAKYHMSERDYDASDDG